LLYAKLKGYLIFNILQRVEMVIVISHLNFFLIGPRTKAKENLLPKMQEASTAQGQSVQEG
jgi:hypothetical protein